MQLWGKRNWLILSSNFTKRKNLSQLVSLQASKYDTDYFLHCTIPDWISSSQPQFPSLTWLPNFWITHNNKLWCTLQQTAKPERKYKIYYFEKSIQKFCRFLLYSKLLNKTVQRMSDKYTLQWKTAVWVKSSVTMREKKPIMASRPFHLSALAVKGPKLRASVDSPFIMGTKDAYVSNWIAPTK